MATTAPDQARTVMDEESFEALVRAHHPVMVGLARALTTSEADADRAVRRAWQDVISDLHSVDAAAPPRAWILSRVTAGLAARRSSRDRSSGELTPAGMGAERVSRALREAIDDLPEDERAVVRLRDVEGWSSQEICDALGVSAGDQRVLLHRARSALRGALYGPQATRAS